MGRKKTGAPGATRSSPPSSSSSPPLPPSPLSPHPALQPPQRVSEFGAPFTLSLARTCFWSCFAIAAEVAAFIATLIFGPVLSTLSFLERLLLPHVLSFRSLGSPFGTCVNTASPPAQQPPLSSPSPSSPTPSPSSSFPAFHPLLPYTSPHLSCRYVTGFGWTDILSVGKTSAPLTFIMIPGNPGTVEFYEEYLHVVHDASAGAVRCVCIGHLGHSKRSGDHEGGRVFSLADQIAHKRVVIEEMLQHTSSPIVLGGHSVGAHVCVELLRHLPAERVQRVLGLCPTVAHIGLTPNGRKLYPWMKHMRRPLARIVGLVAMAPATALRLLAATHLGQKEAWAVSGALALVHGNVLRNTLTMAFHEMHEIAHPDENHLKRVSKKLLMLYAPNDGWVGTAHEALFRSICPDSTIVNDKDVAHAFVLKSSRHVGLRTWAWIQEAVGTAK